MQFSTKRTEKLYSATQKIQNQVCSAPSTPCMNSFQVSFLNCMPLHGFFKKFHRSGIFQWIPILYANQIFPVIRKHHK